MAKARHILSSSMDFGLNGHATHQGSLTPPYTSAFLQQALEPLGLWVHSTFQKPGGVEGCSAHEALPSPEAPCASPEDSLGGPHRLPSAKSDAGLMSQESALFLPSWDTELPAGRRHAA